MTNVSPSENKGLADKVLRACHDVCQERGIRFFVHQGSALGLYRDGTWIEDNDVDIAVIGSQEDYQSVWNALRVLPGWSDTSGLRKGPIQLDLQRVPPDPPYTPPGWKPNPFTCEEFDVIEYEGMSLLVPSPIEDYLQWEYTEIWRTPIAREIWWFVVDWMQRRIDGRHYD